MEIRPIEGFLKDKIRLREVKSGDFLQEISKFIHWVNKEQQKANAIREAFLKGADIPLHQMVIEFEKAHIALNLLIQVRNKILEAYQEINRMQV